MNDINNKIKLLFFSPCWLCWGDLANFYNKAVYYLIILWVPVEGFSGADEQTSIDLSTSEWLAHCHWQPQFICKAPKTQSSSCFTSCRKSWWQSPPSSPTQPGKHQLHQSQWVLFSKDMVCWLNEAWAYCRLTPSCSCTNCNIYGK